MNPRILCSLVLPLSFLAAWPAAGQQLAQESAPKTKLEAFQAQTGAVVVKGYTAIGRIAAMGSVEVSSMEFTDAATGRKQTGVLIEIKEQSRLENTDRSFIDYEEVDALLKGLDYCLLPMQRLGTMSTLKYSTRLKSVTLQSYQKVDWHSAQLLKRRRSGAWDAEGSLT